MIVNSLADITGDGATHAITVDLPSQAKWVQLLADPSNSGRIRVGGPNTTGSIGLPLTPGASTFYPQDHADVTSYYPLFEIFYNAANGDKLYVQYGVG